MADMHGIGTTIPAADGTFLPQQVDLFQKEDRAGARSVILLMLGVFSIGLIGSAITCYQVWPHDNTARGDQPAATKSAH
ncbi:MAG: hypothetical protein ACJ8C4_21920 [Gemmataceae bacterium]